MSKHDIYCEGGRCRCFSEVEYEDVGKPIDPAPEQVEALARVLADHEGSANGCSCGGWEAPDMFWTYRSLVSHREHLATVLASLIAEAAEKAREEGRRAGLGGAVERIEALAFTECVDDTDAHYNAGIDDAAGVVGALGEEGR